MKRKISQRIATFVGVLLVPLVASSGVALAAYGPPGPPGPPGTGGYGCVLTSQQVAASTATTIGPIKDGNLLITVHIPAGTFSRPVQVTLTEPFSRGGSGACSGGTITGRRGRGRALAGAIGVLIEAGNQIYRFFPRGVTLTITDPSLTGNEIGEVAPLFDDYVGPVEFIAHGDSVTIRLDSSSEWAFLVRQSGRLRPFTTRRNSRTTGTDATALTVTAALLPRGSALPGNGVLVAAGNGHTLSTRGSAALAK